MKVKIFKPPLMIIKLYRITEKSKNYQLILLKKSMKVRLIARKEGKNIRVRRAEIRVAHTVTY